MDEPNKPDPAASLPSPRHPRHDGWTGERMARFLEVLADTGIVTEACRAAGMSRNSAYSLRNRDAVFDSAWRAALTKARPLIADGISNGASPARSNIITGMALWSASGGIMKAGLLSRFSSVSTNSPMRTAAKGACPPTSPATGRPLSRHSGPAGARR